MYAGNGERVLGGNCRAPARERSRAAGASREAVLAGQARVVGGVGRGLIIDAMRCGDGHAQEGTLMERVEDVAAEFDTHPAIHEILAFIREGGKRSICTPRAVAAAA